ncbi:hypothetical protein [Novosphingobium pentaromativorans]|uniref:hypothetical protein n=1 Tax=Novosphingobium pentaromativorans TaxID=205844 RepID=UPI00051F8552|nr:hypothetical protein [Novosphingobium pentaromativorans]AIT79099.1 hypothetical protein JI59_04405 [Novosphingobium pentaromativorans US6-1]
MVVVLLGALRPVILEPLVGRVGVGIGLPLERLEVRSGAIVFHCIRPDRLDRQDKGRSNE